MARRTLQESLKTKDSILQVAIRVATDEGFGSLSLEAVSRMAGVTRGAVYHHFENREGLVRAATETLLREMGTKILAAAEAQTDPWHALEAGCIAFLRQASSREYKQIVLIDAPSILGIAVWQELDTQYTTSTLVEAMDELQENGRISVTDTSAAAQALSGAMNQLALWIDSGHQASEAELMLKQLLESLRNS